jgi:hypothetical protein
VAVKFKIMKKISLFSLALVASLAVFAQDNPPARTPRIVATHFGLKGGVNMAEYNLGSNIGGSTNGVDMRTSFNAGAFVNVPIAGSFRIQPEVVFSGQGSKLTNSSGSAYDESLHYINVPVMLQWQSMGGFFLETGPQAGFLVGAKDKVTSGSAAPNTETDIKDSRKGFDFSWGAGLGYISRVGLGVGARYNYGISNVLNTNNSTNDALYNSSTAKNSVIQFSVIYEFGAGK